MLNLLPVAIRVRFIATVIKTVVFFIPAFKKVSFRNISFAFPEKTFVEQNEIYRKSIIELARLIMDFGRLQILDKAWVEENVVIDKNFFQSLKNDKPFHPTLFATGHLGSFELMAHAAALSGFPLSFIVRNFSLTKLDQWWTENRERNGNTIIPRKGAVTKMMQQLAEGRNCALLFDQNVKRNHAVFVPWFGRKAATTFTLGVSAIRTEANVIVASVRYRSDGRYEIITEVCPTEDIYADDSMSIDDKILQITSRAAAIFESHIKAFPEGWFWMHRRWKTRPEGETENFYS